MAYRCDQEDARVSVASLILPLEQDDLRVRLNRNIVRMDICGAEAMLNRDEAAKLEAWLKQALEQMT
jgi:hypothetical protein